MTAPQPAPAAEVIEVSDVVPRSKPMPFTRRGFAVLRPSVVEEILEQEIPQGVLAYDDAPSPQYRSAMSPCRVRDAAGRVGYAVHWEGDRRVRVRYGDQSSIEHDPAELRVVPEPKQGQECVTRAGRSRIFRVSGGSMYCPMLHVGTGVCWADEVELPTDTLPDDQLPTLADLTDSAVPTPPPQGVGTAGTSSVGAR